jgi:hypothetical protein
MQRRSYADATIGVCLAVLKVTRKQSKNKIIKIISSSLRLEILVYELFFSNYFE